MKRIQAACLLQTIHFQQKEPMSPEAAAQANRMEFERYKSQLARGYTKYQITDEKTLPDGTLEIKLKKQYNSYSIGNYFD